ncbi:MAG: hypothetical protein DK841_03255 [Candidatus Melainabacteria bacterium]|nr:MAG: hypothetical protein DK841_03255 [Candidatus Melainabacteria bacterium]
MVGKLFNDLLIDKLRFYINDTDFDINNRAAFLTNIEKVMSSHYPDNAYRLNTSRQRISLEFTPTRYRTNEGQTDTNLIMLEEQTLFELFENLGFYDLPENIYNSFIISKIHLTKNFYTQGTVPRYIEMLKKRKYRAGINPIQNTSNSTNTSLILSTLKKDSTNKNIVGDKVILFYDKVQELRDKASLNDIFLPSPLSPIDRDILPIGAYHNSQPYLSLQNLHILRCELQYAYSKKLKNISDFISNTTNSHDLRLATLLDLLQEENLYNTLERFYTNELRNRVFFNEPITQEVHLSKHEKLLAELIKVNKISATRLLGMYKGSQKNSLSRVLKKLQMTDSSNKLYVELYRKVIEGRNS